MLERLHKVHMHLLYSQFFIFNLKSFEKVANLLIRDGPSMETCGTPHIISNYDLYVPFNSI